MACLKGGKVWQIGIVIVFLQLAGKVTIYRVCLSYSSEHTNNRV